MNTPVPFEHYLAIAPEIGLLILIVIVLAYERFIRADERRRIGLLTAWGTLAIIVMTLGLWLLFDIPALSANVDTAGSQVWGRMIRNDYVTLVFRLMFLSATLITSLIACDVRRLQRSEFFGLLLMVTVGLNLMAAASDIIMLYVALETASISLYILAGFATTNNRSVEAGMKYFIYGAFASALMLYGFSWMYGLTGVTNIYDIAGAAGAQISANIPSSYVQGNPFGLAYLVAAVLIIVGFGFKISLVPFHFWTPDVYEGAPTAVTAFLSTASKAAGFAVFIRLFTSGAVGAPAVSSPWWAILAATCIVTMTLGNMMAIWQRNIKRMLAYSSIGQAGYAMIGLVSLTSDGYGATMFYLLMYVFTNIAAFAVIILVSNVTDAEEMEHFYGLSRRSPYVALVMMFALLSLGGIPPTAGFFGKFFVFKAAVDAGLWWLAMIGVVNAFISLYYYLGVIKYMYLYRSDDEAVAIPVSRAAGTALAVTFAGIILLGVIPGAVFDGLTQQAARAFMVALGG